MNSSNQNITLEILLKSLEDGFDTAERARIFQKLKDTEPTDDALLGAKMLLEDNNWDYTVLKNAFGKTEERINSIVGGEIVPKTQKTNYFRYAAILVAFITIVSYFLLNNTPSIDNYFVKDKGIPNLMSTSESATDWQNLMKLYKSDNLEKAFEVSSEIINSKKDNDTANYYHAVLAYDLKDFDTAKKYFGKVVRIKGSVFKSDAEFRLSFTFLKLSEKEKAKEQFEVIKNSDSPYNSDAETILNKVLK